MRSKKRYTLLERCALRTAAEKFFEQNGFISSHNLARIAKEMRFPFKKTINSILYQLDNTITIKYWNGGLHKKLESILDVGPDEYTRIMIPNVGARPLRVYYLSAYKLTKKEIDTNPRTIVNILSERGYKKANQIIPFANEYSTIADGEDVSVLWLEE